MTTTDETKDCYRDLIAAFNEGEFDRLDDLVSDEFVLHEAGQSDPIRGPEGLKAFFEMYRTAYPDAHLEIDSLVAEDDIVAGRWTGTGTHDGDLMGVPPTGNEVTVMGMEFVRITDGKLVEGWEVIDSLGMFQQVDAIPEDLSAATPSADD